MKTGTSEPSHAAQRAHTFRKTRPGEIFSAGVSVHVRGGILVLILKQAAT